MDPAAWAGLGLVELEGEFARPTVALLPTEGFVVAYDADLPGGDTRRDHVMGVTPATRTFSQSVMRVPADRTLDLGTGCGYLALRAAAHSQHVLATDVNPPRRRHRPVQCDAQSDRPRRVRGR